MKQERHITKFRLKTQNYCWKPGECCSSGDSALNPSKRGGWVGGSAVWSGPLTLERNQC